jgi:hypothetical protein
MTIGHLVAEKLGISRHKHCRPPQIIGRQSNRKGKKTTQAVASKPRTRFLRGLPTTSPERVSSPITASKKTREGQKNSPTRFGASKEPPDPVRKNKVGRSGAPTRSPDRTKLHSPGLSPAPKLATTRWTKARSTLLRSDDATSTKRMLPGHLNLANLQRQAKKHRSPTHPKATGPSEAEGIRALANGSTQMRSRSLFASLYCSTRRGFERGLVL